MKPWTFRKLLRGRGDTTQQNDDAISIVLPRSLPAADSRSDEESMTGKQIIVKVKRQVSPQGSPYWEEFALQWRPAMNVIICLRDIAENPVDRKSTRLNSSHSQISYAVFCLKKKK